MDDIIGNSQKFTHMKNRSGDNIKNTSLNKFIQNISSSKSIKKTGKLLNSSAKLGDISGSRNHGVLDSSKTSQGRRVNTKVNKSYCPKSFKSLINSKSVQKMPPSSEISAKLHAYYEAKNRNNSEHKTSKRQRSKFRKDKEKISSYITNKSGIQPQNLPAQGSVNLNQTMCNY